MMCRWWCWLSLSVCGGMTVNGVAGCVDGGNVVVCYRNGNI